MPARSMLFAEVVALRALSELDQAESDFIWCIESKRPTAMAGALQLLGLHLLQTIRDLQMATVVSEAELALTKKSLSTGMSTES